uniref:UV radiation resistance-associated protein-like n=1 Tax=Styela clava TaxID=7725 RepID=UPI001939CCC1|nr:UV radiation resistance-associated protein-like [Styela clava]
MQRGDESQRNIHALLQQRRLRHITGVYIRNLRIPQYDSVISSDNATTGITEAQSVPKIFIKIFANLDKNTDLNQHQVIFESELIDLCSNPQWINFDIPKTELSTGNQFTLQLWQRNLNTGESDTLLSWNWNLSRLSYIAEYLHRAEIVFSPNALIIQISGSFYSLSQCFSTDSPYGNCPRFNLDEEKGSCNVFSLTRMVTCHKSITQAKQRTTNYAETSRLLMQNTEIHRIKLKQIEDARKRIKRLKLLLYRESSMLKTEQSELHALQYTYTNKDSHLSGNRTIVVDERDRFNEASDKIIVLRQRTGLLSGKLRSRHMDVLSELAYIFPILPYTVPSTGKNSTSGKGQNQVTKQVPAFTICDIHLAEAESLIPKDDTKNAVAMGYVSQMLYMISYFLLIPVRYPMILQGSQTSIIDNVLEKIQEKERVFPLYSRSSKERFLFDYAIYLLNKNIGQMRYILGIQTSDLRPTLFNLKTLLEHAFGAQNQSKPIMIRSPRYDAPQIPPTSTPPQPQRKGTNRESEMNGIRKTPINLEEKVHDRSAELNNLRGELFGNKKNAKSVSISPRRIQSNSIKKNNASVPVTHLTVPNDTDKPLKSIIDEDVGVIVPETGDTNAIFLTGLEDLDQGPKNVAKSKKPIDVVAARNELFKTKSGRPIITKRHTYTMRATSSSSPRSETYFSTKEELFKRSSVTKRTNEGLDAFNNTTSYDSLSESTSNIENNNLKIPPSASVPITDDFDLC